MSLKCLYYTVFANSMMFKYLNQGCIKGLGAFASNTSTLGAIDQNKFNLSVVRLPIDAILHRSFNFP